MKVAQVPAVLLVVLLAATRGVAQDAKIMTVTDPAVPIPGMTVITDYHGPLPPGGGDTRDVPQMPGFPITMAVNPNFAPVRGVVFADLDLDGKLDIIAASTNGKIYAWDYTGKPMPGFPVSTIGMCQYPPSVADVDGDGYLELVQCTRGQTSGGRLYLIDHLGHVRPGFPVSINNNNVEYSAALYDLDHDGKMEIIVGERAWPIGYLHIYRTDGTQWGGNWPVALDHVPAASASVGDVDNDGNPEIFYLSYNSMYLLRTDGTPLPGWPRQIPNANFSYQSAALADLDHDGKLEIVVGAHGNAPGCYVFHHDGTLLPGWPQLLGTWTYCPPTVTDLDGDGALEIIDGRAGVGFGNSACFWVWNTAGVVRPGFPYMAYAPYGGGSEGPLTAADVDNDGRKEIFADNNIMDANGKGFLFGVDASGQNLTDFPLRPAGFTYLNGATIGDVDNNGTDELGVLSVNGGTAYVNLYTLPSAHGHTRGDWKTYLARDARGGLYPGGFGDMNCDGLLDFADIDPFVLALNSYAAYHAQYPNCNWLYADCNYDGLVNFGDIDPFVALLTE